MPKESLNAKARHKKKVAKINKNAPKLRAGYDHGRGGPSREDAAAYIKGNAKKRKAMLDKQAKAVSDDTYREYLMKYQDEIENSPKRSKFFDKIGDNIRHVAGDLTGNATFSRDNKAQMDARKDIKGYKEGGVTKPRGYGMARGGRACKIS
tara:strand:- start:12782 stop:13234 length:453 start_codon:yes stop_codon:yes gene_type:complete